MAVYNFEVMDWGTYYVSGMEVLVHNNKMALMSDWGERDNVSVARIPAGTKVKHAIGTAKEQVGATESRPGGGLQLLFEYFDENWIIEI